MSYKLKHLWGAAIEDSLPDGAQGDFEGAESDVAEIEVDEDGAPLEAVDAEGEPTVDAMETEMVEAEDEVDTAEDTVEELDDTQESLESMRAVLESRIASRQGISAGELEFMMIGVEARVPVRPGMFPSVESAKADRMTAAVEALESVKAGLASIWNRIMDAIKNLFAKVKNWYLKNLDAAPRLKKRAEGVAKKAAKVSGSISNKKISLSNNRTICDSNFKGYSTGDSAITAYKKVSDIASSVIGQIIEKEEDANSSFESNLSDALDILKTGKGNGWDAGDVVDAFKATFSKISDLDKAVGGKLNHNLAGADSRYKNVDVASSEELPGRKAVVLLKGYKSSKKIESSGDITAHFRNCGLRLVEVDDNSKKSAEGSSDYATLSSAQVQDICTYVITAMDGIIGFKKNWERRDKNQKEILKSIDREVKDIDKMDDDEITSATRSLIVGCLNGYRGLVTGQVTSFGRIVSYIMDVSKAFLLYCTRSLAQYKK